ncbi:MAG: hypothetical protein P1U74_04420 [Legionellaceae bacterium]|nr:hypothetical protein [Legionellaceae bacterium]
MSKDTLTGLNPFGISTGCIKDDIPQKDILLTDFIAQAWGEELGFLGALSVTYNILVGKHRSYNIYSFHDDSSPISNYSSFKGVLDIFILPLVARRLWNWSEHQLEKGDANGFTMKVAVECARMFAAVISLVRIVVGIALTVLLSPFVGMVCLLKPKDNSYSDDKVQDNTFESENNNSPTM